MELEEGLQENAVQLYKIFEQKGGAVRRSDLMNKGLRPNKFTHGYSPFLSWKIRLDE